MREMVCVMLNLHVNLFCCFGYGLPICCLVNTAWSLNTLLHTENDYVDPKPLLKKFILPFKGIGREFVRQLAADTTNTVLAIVRDPESPDIYELASNHPNMHVIKGDVTDPKSILEAASAAAAVTGGKARRTYPQLQRR